MPRKKMTTVNAQVQVATKPARGRRSGMTPTKQWILEEAGGALASNGAGAVSVRQVAMRAGVDPALIYYFFGDKETLLREATVYIADAVEQALEGFSSAGSFGEAYARWYFGIWDNKGTGPNMKGLLRLTLDDPEARAIVGQVIGSRIIPHFLDRIADGPNREQRASLIAAHLYGTAIYRYVLEVPWLVTLTLEEMAAMVGPMLDSHMAAQRPQKSKSSKHGATKNG